MAFSLIGELPELTAAMRELERLAALEGITFTTANFGGVRTESDTTRILGYRDADYAAYVTAQQRAGKPALSKEKWRPIAPFGKSMHNYGAARDVSPTGWPKGRTWQWAHDRLDAIAAAHPELGLRAGDSFNDEPHFELAITLEEAKRRYNARLARGSLHVGAVIVGAMILYYGVRWFVRRRTSRA